MTGYIKKNMGYAFALCPEARDQLFSLAERDPETASRIATVLRDINLDPAMDRKLVTQNYAEEDYSTCRVERFAQEFPTRNIWRLRVYWPDRRDTHLPWRVLYAPDWTRRVFVGLYLMERSEDYGKNRPDFAQRVCSLYDRIGLDPPHGD